jgi:hypothetical protein
MRTRSLGDDSYPSDDESRRNLDTEDKVDDGDAGFGAATDSIYCSMGTKFICSFVGYSQITLGLCLCASAKISLIDQHVIVVGMLKC